MENLIYKGFEIEAIPEQIVETGRWIVKICIYKHIGPGVSDKIFSASTTYETKEEAIQHCLNFGKQIIDGQVEDCSVDDL